MIACLDVQYVGTRAAAACVRFSQWEDAEPAAERIQEVAGVEPYQPGSLYRRELPCLLAALAGDAPPRCAVVDGYVWLDGEGRPGLGAHLFQALGGAVPVIGVAKTPFAGSAHALAVRRPGSERPLFITAAGFDLGEAGACIARMAGGHRIPALLRRVDALARSAARRIQRAEP